ncbi:hypothetical protein [Streptomyces sp. NPDC014006]|uniref:hypothetical protein n=1 Tax=Streptomyces sp. NPDC014006 TaxID=3364870 RepID=UPI0036F542CD
MIVRTSGLPDVDGAPGGLFPENPLPQGKPADFRTAAMLAELNDAQPAELVYNAGVFVPTVSAVATADIGNHDMLHDKINPESSEAERSRPRAPYRRSSRSPVTSPQAATLGVFSGPTLHEAYVKRFGDKVDALVVDTANRTPDTLSLSATGALFGVTTATLLHAGLRRRSNEEMHAKKLRRNGR